MGLASANIDVAFMPEGDAGYHVVRVVAYVPVGLLRHRRYYFGVGQRPGNLLTSYGESSKLYSQVGVKGSFSLPTMNAMVSTHFAFSAAASPQTKANLSAVM